MALFGRKGKPDAQGETNNSASVEGGTVALEPGTDYEGGNGAFEAQPVAVKARKGRGPKQPGVKSGTVVGLNIGSNFIKAVEVTNKGGALSVTAMGAVPTPPDSISNGVVMSVGALAEAIKELWRAAGIKSRTVVTSVSGTGSLVVRVIEVPKMTDRELGDNMKVDADRYIPFPPSEVVMDYKALRDLPSDPDSPNMEVLLAAAQQEIIDLHVRAIQSARLDFRAIDVEPLAAVRALQFAQARATGSDWVDYNDVSAVVNIGATATEISVLRGDIVVFTRIVPGGGNALTQAIADTLGVPFAEAEHIKVEAGDALPPHGMESAQPAAHELDDFASFGLDDDTAPISFDDFDTTPMGGGTGQPSTDPFDLDFFNQGPKQDEPGAGHGQAEGEEKPADPFSFNFSFADEAPKASEPTPAPTPVPAPAPPPAAATSFSFEGATPAQPTVPQPATPTPPTPEPSSEFVHAGPMEFSEDEFAIPARDAGDQNGTPEPVSPPAPTVAAVPAAVETEGNLLPSRESAPDPDYDMSDPTGRGGISFNFDDDSLLPSVDTSPSLAPEDPAHEVATPGRMTPMPIAGTPAGDAAAETVLPSFADPSASFTPVPSAFDFGDLDLPTLVEDAPPTVEVSAGVPWTPGVSTVMPETTAAPAPEVTVTPEPVFAEPEPAPAPEPETVAPEAAPVPFSFAFGDEPPGAAAAAPVPGPAPVNPALEPVTTEFEAATQPFTFNTPADAFGTAAVQDDETFAIAPGDTAPAALGESFEEAGAGDFDLDEIFGAGAVGAPAAVPAAPVSAPAPSMSDETFDLGSIGGELGDFGGGLTGDFGAEPDLSSFGAGLTGDQGYGGVDPVTLYAAVHPVVEDLANELRRSLEYHLSRFPDATISRVALVGGGAALLNLDYFLTQMLGIPATVGNPFSQIEIAAPRLPPDYAQDNGAICAVALGLALRDFVA